MHYASTFTSVTDAHSAPKASLSKTSLEAEIKSEATANTTIGTSQPGVSQPQSRTLNSHTTLSTGTDVVVPTVGFLHLHYPASYCSPAHDEPASGFDVLVGSTHDYMSDHSSSAASTININNTDNLEQRTLRVFGEGDRGVAPGVSSPAQNYDMLEGNDDEEAQEIYVSDGDLDACSEASLPESATPVSTWTKQQDWQSDFDHNGPFVKCQQEAPNKVRDDYVRNLAGINTGRSGKVDDPALPSEKRNDEELSSLSCCRCDTVSSTRSLVAYCPVCASQESTVQEEQATNHSTPPRSYSVSHEHGSEESFEQALRTFGLQRYISVDMPMLQRCLNNFLAWHSVKSDRTKITNAFATVVKHQDESGCWDTRLHWDAVSDAALSSFFNKTSWDTSLSDVARSLGSTEEDCRQRWEQIRLKDPLPPPLYGAHISSSESVNPSNSWSAKLDGQLLELRACSEPWTTIAECLNKTTGECKQRFKEIRPKGWMPKNAKQKKKVKSKNPPRDTIVPKDFTWSADGFERCDTPVGTACSPLNRCGWPACNLCFQDAYDGEDNHKSTRECDLGVDTNFSSNGWSAPWPDPSPADCEEKCEQCEASIARCKCNPSPAPDNDHVWGTSSFLFNDDLNCGKSTVQGPVNNSWNLKYRGGCGCAETQCEYSY